METQQQQTINEYMIFLQDIERINTVTEFDQLTEAIDLKKLKDLMPKKLQLIEKALSRYKIGINGLKNKAKAESKNLKKEFDSGKSPEDVSKIITKRASQAISQSLNKSKDKLMGLNLTEKILISLVAFLVIVYINTLLVSVLTLSGVGPDIAHKVLSIVIAPMVEEAAKTFFIERGLPWVGTAVVFGLEYIQYTIQLIFKGPAVIGRMMIVRLSSLLLHFTTTFIQKKIIEKGEENKKDYLFTAWIAGVAVHSMWNILAAVYQENIAGWVLGN
jgi:hypothetical protein